MPPWEKYQQQSPAPAVPKGPWERYAQNKEPETLLDYDAPIEQLRTEIGKLPEDSKKRAYDLWADKRVAKERSLGLGQLPSAERGIPIIGGLLDEATAGISSVMHGVSGGGVGRPYDEALALERARQRQAEDAFPSLATTTQLAAGLATGAPLVGSIAPAATLLGRAGQGVAIGAPLGFAEGFLRGEGGAAERVDSGTSGATGGAAFGGLAPVGGALASRAVGAVADHIAPVATRWRHGADEAADAILARRIAQEGSSPAAKRLDLQTGQQTARLNTNSRADLPETIADTSDAMRRLTGSLYRSGGEAGNFVRDKLTGRQRGPENPYAPAKPGDQTGQLDRVLDTSERALMVRSSETARQNEARILTKQKTDGNRLYNQARAQSETFDLSPVIDGMTAKMQEYPPPFARQLASAIDLFVRPQKVKGRELNVPVDNITRFDNAKKALDDMIDAAQRQGQGNLVRELSGFKNDLLGAVHAPGPNGAPRNALYAQARDTWGSGSENRAAIQLGRDALKENSEVSIDQFRKLTTGQKTLFRLGFVDALRSSLARKKPGNDVTQLFQEKRTQELMNEIIPRSQKGTFANRPERFGEIMNREQRMVQTNNAVLGNSATAMRQQDDMGFAGDALQSMWNRFKSSPSLFSAATEAVGTGIQKVFGYRQDVALAMAKRLLETDPDSRNRILRRLSGRGGPNVFARFADHIDRTGNALTASTTPQIGQLAAPDGPSGR